MNKVRHNFTLLEILVAVAVLVIMMGFLFQFVISAQRVWAASTARTYMADQANAVFQLMAEDLSQVITVTEEEDPDSVMGWFCDPDPDPQPPTGAPGNLNRLFFFAGDRDDADGAVYGIMYYYVHYDKNNPDITGRLYRVRTEKPAWKKVGKTDTPDNYSDFGLLGDTPEAVALATDDPNDTADDYLVAKNITSFVIQTGGSTGTTDLPKFLRVTMTVKTPEELANTASGGQAMDRTFSSLFFIDNGK